MELIENSRDLEQEVKRVSRSHGEEGIELKSGQRVRFRTRTKRWPRLLGDCLILDEAMILPESAHGALLPTLSARPNPPVWYTGSAVDQEVHEHGVVFTSHPQRGLEGGDRLSPASSGARTSRSTSSSTRSPPTRRCGQANPGLGIRVTLNHVANEQRSLDPRTFAVERLGVGDWSDPRGARPGRHRPGGVGRVPGRDVDGCRPGPVRVRRPARSVRRPRSASSARGRCVTSRSSTIGPARAGSSSGSSS